MSIASTRRSADDCAALNRGVRANASPAGPKTTPQSAPAPWDGPTRAAASRSTGGQLMWNERLTSRWISDGSRSTRSHHSSSTPAPESLASAMIQLAVFDREVRRHRPSSRRPQGLAVATTELQMSVRRSEPTPPIQIGTRSCTGFGSQRASSSPMEVLTGSA